MRPLREVGLAMSNKLMVGFPGCFQVVIKSAYNWIINTRDVSIAWAHRTNYTVDTNMCLYIYAVDNNYYLLLIGPMCV